MTEIHGVTGKPYSTPHVRKRLPAPFTRARIDLDGGRHVKRSWKDTSVLDIKEGDIVADVGRIDVVTEFIQTPELASRGKEQTPVVWRVRFINALGDYFDFPGHQRLYAFTADEG